jgi:pyruvate kinase
MVTVGPTLDSPEDLRLAIEAGARWFRLPCGCRQWPQLQNGRAVREAALQQGIPVRLLLDVPAFGEDADLLEAFAAEKLTPDWVALGSVSSPEEVRAGRREVRRRLGRSVRIMARFETVAAVECAEDILNAADGIMVARGALGLAAGYIRLPEVQERLVKAARRAHRPVVVATHVLEMFAETGLPQRAELSDLSLLARQRANAVLVGKETVISPRPLECIRLAREVLAYETQRFERLALASRQRRTPAANFAAVKLAGGQAAAVGT